MVSSAITLGTIDGIAITQIEARAPQSTSTLSYERVGQRAHTAMPSRATFRRKPGRGNPSGCVQSEVEIGTG